MWDGAEQNHQSGTECFPKGSADGRDEEESDRNLLYRHGDDVWRSHWRIPSNHPPIHPSIRIMSVLESCPCCLQVKAGVTTVDKTPVPCRTVQSYTTSCTPTDTPELLNLQVFWLWVGGARAPGEKSWTNNLLGEHKHCPAIHSKQARKFILSTSFFS